MHEFFFDDDDAGQVQLLPAQYRDYCAREFEAITEHSRTYLTPDGIGWTRIYWHRAPDPSLPRVRFTADQFVELLQPHAKRFDRLVSPLSDVNAELGIRRIGFGPRRHVGIIADLKEDDVAMIWCALATSDAGEQALLADMLTALCGHQHLLLVDWRELRLVDLRSRTEIEDYLGND